MERLGRVSESDRSFDIEFWQKQGPSAIFAAAWQMVIDTYKLKGWSDSELRLQRSIEKLERMQR